MACRFVRVRQIGCGMLSLVGIFCLSEDLYRTVAQVPYFGNDGRVQVGAGLPLLGDNERRQAPLNLTS